MKYKTIAITIFFFLLLPIANIYAVIALELVINDELKECRTYQSYANSSLPENWTYHEFEKSYDEDTHKTECERIGYIYNPEMLEGKINPAYLVIKYTFWGLFAITLFCLLIAYFKTKKKKILVAISIIIILYLFLYSVLLFTVG